MPVRSCLLALAGLACAGGVTPAAAQVGTYDVEGQTLGGEAYAGTVRVTKTGDTFRVEWRVGSDSYVGTAIGDANVLAVAFAGTRPGVALYSRGASAWEGAWTFSNDRRVSSERWLPR